MEKRKVRLYEWVRIFATLIVILGHSQYLRIITPCGGVDYLYILPEASTTFALLHRFLAELGAFADTFHMPLFFILSGAVLHLKPIGEFDTFLQKKSRRLLVPYFAVGLLYMFPIKFLANFYNRNSIVSAIRSFMVTTEDSGHLWFLAALFWCMVIFAVLVKLMEQAHCQSRGGYFFASLLLKVLLPYLPFDFLGMKLGATYLVWFALGYCLDDLRGWLEKQEPKRLSLLLLLVIFLCRVRRLWAGWTLVVLGSALVVLLSELCTRVAGRWEQTKIYRVFTRNLFNIYLFHDPLNYLMLRVFVHYEWYRIKGPSILFFLARTFGVLVVSIGIGEGWNRIWSALKQAGTEQPRNKLMLNR